VEVSICVILNLQIIGNMDLEGSVKDSVLTTTQVSIGGFDSDVKASDLVSYLVISVFNCNLALL
jgi:hypothetical protein